jgi:drug/metabolite transporter (DMT)-like permease
MNKKVIHWGKASIIILGWSLTPVIGDYLVDQTSQVNAYQLAFFRYFLAAVAIYIILMFQRKVSNKDILDSVKKNWWKYIIVSIPCAFMPVLLFLAVNTTTASTASFLLNSNIILIPIVAFFIIKEKITKRYFVGLATALIGVFFVIFDENLLDLANLSLGSVGGNLLALGSGLSWALYTVFLKKFFSEDNPLLVTLVSLLMGSIYLVFFAFLIPPVEMSINVLGVFLILVIAVLATAFAYSLWLDILSYLTTTETGIIQALVPIFSVVWSVAFLSEAKTVTYFFGIGAVLIIVSIIIVETRKPVEEKVEN